MRNSDSDRELFQGLFHVFVEKPDEIWADILGSLGLLFWGFFLAVIFGTALGLLAGWIPRVREVLLPISNAITLIPPLMFSAYLIMCLSTFRQAAIGVIFFCRFLAYLPGNGDQGRTDGSVCDRSGKNHGSWYFRDAGKSHISLLSAGNHQKYFQKPSRGIYVSVRCGDAGNEFRNRILY